MSATATRPATDRYPSRRATDERILSRSDPVVWGDADGPLDPELVAAFDDDGFIVVPGLLAPSEVDQVNAEIDRRAADPAVRSRPQAIVEPDSDELRSLFEIHRGDDPLARLARDPRLTGVARQLLGSDVYVHQSRINLKPGFRGREFAWHSDFETWHAEDGMPRPRALSASILLTPNHTWNGPLLCIRGSHHSFVSCVGETPERNHERSLREQVIGVPSDSALVDLVDRGGIVECVGPPGTVVFFECNVMHGSNSNISPIQRRNVFVVYNSVDNALVDPYAAPAPRPEHIASRDVAPV